MAQMKEPYVKVQEIIMQTPTVSSAASTSNIGGVIVSPVGPRLAYVTSPVEFLKLYTADGETIPRKADTTFINAYYLSYYSGLVISRSINTNALGGLLVYKDNNNWATQKFIQKDDSIMTKVSHLRFLLDSDDSVNPEGSEPNWAFAMNDTVYYNRKGWIDGNTGDLVPAFTEAYSNYTIFKECETLEDMIAILENTDDVHVESSTVDSETGSLTIVYYSTEYVEFEIKDAINITVTTNEDDNVSYTSGYDLITVDESTWLFSIVGDIPLATNTNKIEITNTSDPDAGNKFFDLTLTTGSDDPQKYFVTLSKDGTLPGDTTNWYIEYINTQNIGYTVTVYNSENIPNSTNISQTFGASGFDEDKSKSNSNIFEALDYLSEQEIYDVEYLAPFGLTNSAIANRYQIVSNANKWFCPIDVPKDRTTYTAVKMFEESFIKQYQNMPTGLMLGPFDRKTNLTGWYTDIAPSTLYFERVMLNKQNSAEFAPVFRSDYGTMNYSNPVKLFKKTERTDLLSLDKPINWVVYDQKSSTYYMNDNRTFQSDQESVVCEEQNARLVWKISKDVAKIVDKFIGKYNTRTTRAAVVDAITYYLEWNIMNKKFPPEAYIIQCDEYNNPDSLINENKLAVELKIRLYKAIKYVEVINRVFPLGVDFSTSI